MMRVLTLSLQIRVVLSPPLPVSGGDAPDGVCDYTKDDLGLPPEFKKG